MKYIDLINYSMNLNLNNQNFQFIQLDYILQNLQRNFKS